MLIYCDSMDLIYFLDHAGPWHVRAANRLAAISKVGDSMVISDLVRRECRVTPIRNRDSLALGSLGQV
jgi:hypothetical protein